MVVRYGRKVQLNVGQVVIQVAFEDDKQPLLQIDLIGDEHHLLHRQSIRVPEERAKQIVAETGLRRVQPEQLWLATEYIQDTEGETE